MEGMNYSENYERVFPLGYRFCPTDQEIIVNYLRRKINEPGFSPFFIKEVDLYDFHPEELTEKYGTKGEHCQYFFTSTMRKYPKGFRPQRSAIGGFWKATGGDKKIGDSQSNEFGIKKSLVFYNGIQKKGHSEKTNWIMKEFRIKQGREDKNEKKPMELDKWVLGKIYKTHYKAKVGKVKDVKDVEGHEGQGEVAGQGDQVTDKEEDISSFMDVDQDKSLGSTTLVQCLPLDVQYLNPSSYDFYYSSRNFNMPSDHIYSFSNTSYSDEWKWGSHFDANGCSSNTGLLQDVVNFGNVFRNCPHTCTSLNADTLRTQLGPIFSMPNQRTCVNNGTQKQSTAGIEGVIKPF